MFKKLQNKFIRLNMTMISLLIIATFSIIFIMTYNNTMESINERINMAMDNSRGRDDMHQMDDSMPPQNSENRSQTTPPAKPDGKRGKPNLQPPLIQGAFTVTTTIEGTITKIDSVFDLDKDVYEAAINAALAEEKDTEIIHINGAYWKYKIAGQGSGYRIGFLDITSDMQTLVKMIYTFILVSILALIIIYIISWYFAKRAITPIESAWEKQNQFIADASHELKTPLTVINTNIDVVLGNTQSTVREQSKWLIYIKNEIERMTKLTNDLLYLAKVDETNNDTIYFASDFSEAVNNVILSMEAVAFEKKINLDYDIEEAIMVEGDNAQLKQITIILADNAIKYAKKDISISLKRVGQYARLLVINDGEVINQEDMEHIFDRFYRLDKSRNRESGGYGLGLSIAKAIVKKYKGRIWVKSENETTVFGVEFNIVK